MISRLYGKNKDAFNYFIVVILQTGIQIAIIPFLTAALSTEDYSDLSLANNIFGILVILTHFGFINTFSVLYYKEKSSWALTNNVIFSYGFNILTISFLGILSAFFFDVFPLDIYFILLIFLATFLEVYFELFRTKLRLESLSMQYLGVMALKLVGFNLVFLYLVYFYGFDGRAKFLGLLLVVAMILVPTCFRFRKLITFSDFSKSSIKRIFKKSSSIAPGQIAKTVQNTFDVFVVFYLIGKIEFALFAIVVQLSRPLERFSASLLDAYIPKLYKSLSTGLKPSSEDYKNQIKYTLLVFLAAVSAIFFGPIIFEILVSNEYMKEGIILFPFLVGGRYIFSIAQYHEMQIIYHGKYKFSSLINVINMGLMVLLFYLLFERFNIIGIGYAYLTIKVCHYLLLVFGYQIFKLPASTKLDNLSVATMVLFVFLYHL